MDVSCNRLQRMNYAELQCASGPVQPRATDPDRKRKWINTRSSWLSPLDFLGITSLDLARNRLFHFCSNHFIKGLHETIDKIKTRRCTKRKNYLFSICLLPCEFIVSLCISYHFLRTSYRVTFWSIFTVKL